MVASMQLEMEKIIGNEYVTNELFKLNLMNNINFYVYIVDFFIYGIID